MVQQGSHFQQGNKSTLIFCWFSRNSILGLCCAFCTCVLTIFGFAGAVVWLQQVALHTAAGVGALGVCACLTARPVHIALIEIYRGTTIYYLQRQPAMRCIGIVLCLFTAYITIFFRLGKK